MGCIVVKACDPSPPESAICDFWHISGVHVDTSSSSSSSDAATSSHVDDEQRVQHCPPGVLYVYNSQLVYRARHCTFGRGPKLLQYEICQIKDINSFNKFTSRKDGKTFGKHVLDVTVSPAVNLPDVHIGFETKQADKIASRLHEICQKHRQKPKIFQFNSIDIDGIEINLP